MEEFELEFATLSLDDLQEEYGKLFMRYRLLRDTAEEDAQRIYELRRSLETASAAEAYLSQELEQLTQSLSTYATESNTLTKTQTELEELRRQHHTLSGDYTTLQQDYEALREENVNLRKQMEQVKSTKRLSVGAAGDSALAEEQAKRLDVLEEENMELLQKLEEFQAESVRQTLALADKEKNVEILRDQVTCLEENLRSKREDLDEKTNLLESTQEQLAEANARLASLAAKPNNLDRKGNSLFAEVDDQRQAMKQLLAAQKKSYLQMRKIFNDSQYEIRKLKRENVAMHTELRECSSIFCNADKRYQDKLNERIRHLLNQVNGLERQLSLTQERLKEIASEKGVAWVDSMLNFCKQETNELKLQLHSVRIQNASLEEQLRNVQQDMARWRFESLKSRCVLLDRENLLNENNITFKPMNAMEFHITDKEQQIARPRIVHVTPQKAEPVVVKHEITLESTFDNIESISSSIADMSLSTSFQQTPNRADIKVEEDKENVSPVARSASLEPAQGVNNQNTGLTVRSFAQEMQLDKSTNEQDSPKGFDSKNIHSPVMKMKKQQSQPSPVVQTAEEKNEQSTILVKENIENNSSTIAVKHTESNINCEHPGTISSSSIVTKCAKKQPLDANAVPGPSILSKGRDIFANIHEEKNVQFSAQAPLVHDISVDTSLSPKMAATPLKTTPANGNENSEKDKGDVKPPKVTIKQMRTKSNIVVRRVVLGAKQERK